MGWCQAVFLTCDPQSTSHKREKEINWTTSKLKPLGLQRALKKVTKQRIKWESSVQLLSHVRLCDPVDRSTPAFPVHHQLPEFTQTHVH